jgi:hypothetical protein
MNYILCVAWFYAFDFLWIASGYALAMTTASPPSLRGRSPKQSRAMHKSMPHKV